MCKGERKMDITIVGTGYVGLTAGVCLASKNHNIICIDIEKEKFSYETLQLIYNKSYYTYC